jgi:phage/plasmid-associated DNA primase
MDTKHDLYMEESSNVEIHAGKLCTKDGDQFAPVTDQVEIMREASLEVLYTVPINNDGVPDEAGHGSTERRLRIGFSSERGAVGIELSDPGEANRPVLWEPLNSEVSDKVLTPASWLTADVVAARGFDPHKKLLLKVALDESQQHMAELLKIDSNGLFKSRCITTERGVDKHVLRVCNSRSKTWAEDTGGEAYHELYNKNRKNISLLAEDTEWLKNTMEELEAEDSITPNMRKRLGKSLPEAICRAFDPFEATADWKVRDLFTVAVSDSKFEYNTKKILCFSNGVCYDVEARKMRATTPEDGSTLNTGYDYQAPDPEKIAKIKEFLLSVYVDPEVVEWDLGERAQCLTFTQLPEGRARFSFGVAGGGKTMMAKLTKAAFGDEYAFQADEALFRPSRFESAEAPKSMRARLENKLYVFCDEIKGLDKETVKAWTGGAEINARGMRKETRQFPAEFHMLEFTFNLQDDPAKDVKFERDDGIERRARAVRYLNVLSKEQTAQIDGIFALAPQLMAYMIKLHQDATSPGGSWPPEPPQVEEWTAQMWVGAATVNPLVEPMNTWYKRCACTPKDPDVDDNLNLIKPESRTPCTHYILGADLMEKLKKKTLLNGTTLYKSIKGKGRNDAPIYLTLARVQMGSPPITILKKDKAMGGKVNVIFGLVPKNPTPFDMCAAAASSSGAGSDGPDEPNMS